MDLSRIHYGADPRVIFAGSAALESGALTGVGANGPVWSLRYSGTGLAIIERVSMFWVTTTAFTTAQLLDHALFVARGFTASDSGGNAATISGDNMAYQTKYGLSGMGDIRIASTAALTAGTRTVDATPIAASGYFASGQGANNTTSGPQDGINLYKADPRSEDLVLAQNEGLVLQNVTAMGAAGVIKLIVNVKWKEVTDI